jgi:acetyl-CoA carboxylase biotin carboxylase subunit
MVTGFDLVQEQLRVAANETLSATQDQLAIEGHAIECRVNAEDPFAGFKPSPGLVQGFEPPAEGEQDGVRVRLDSHVRPGYRIPVFYDSMIGKLIVAGPDRAAAIAGMVKALQAFRVEGVKTTIPVHLQIMQADEFTSGDYDTGFIARLLG